MRYYDIHDILTVATDIDLKIPECFETEKIPIPNLVVHEGPVEFPEKNAKRAGVFRYAVQENNRLFIDYKLPKVLPDARIEIHDIENNFHVRFTNAVRKNGDIMKLAETIFRLLLINRGYPLIHAGGFVNRGMASLITAPPDHGKTSTTLSQLNGETRFLADDHVFIGNRIAKSYPRPVNLSPFTETGDLPSKSNTPGEKIKQTMIRSRWELLFGKLGVDMGERIEIPEDVIINEAPIHNVFLLKPGEKGISKVAPIEAVRSIFTSSMDEFSLFSHYALLLYANAFDIDLFDILDDFRNIIWNSIIDADCYRLTGPEVSDYIEMVEQINE